MCMIRTKPLAGCLHTSYGRGSSPKVVRMNKEHLRLMMMKNPSQVYVVISKWICSWEILEMNDVICCVKTFGAQWCFKILRIFFPFSNGQEKIIWTSSLGQIMISKSQTVLFD